MFVEAAGAGLCQPGQVIPPELGSGMAGDSPGGQEGSLPHRHTDFSGFYLPVAGGAEPVIIHCHLLETRMAAAPSGTLQLTAAFSPQNSSPRGIYKDNETHLMPSEELLVGLVTITGN